jgi:DNA repair protein RadD
MMTLRKYQLTTVADVEAVNAALIDRVIIVAPTSSGKTVTIAEYMRRAVAAGKRVLFLAHRAELLPQAHGKLYAFGITAGIISAALPKHQRPQAMVQIASVQTLHARAFRTKSMELPDADIVIIDECHHARAKTYKAIIDAYPNAIIIGLTATPCRGDGRGLGNIFERMIECASISDLIKGGYLVPAKIYAPKPPDLRGVKVESTGDYNIGQLSDRMNTDALVGDVIWHWLKYAERGRTIVFAVDVAHSIHLTDEFQKAGVRAEHLDGTTPADEREAILRRLASGETEVVVNCMVLTEGFDCPDVRCIVLARPTRSLLLFRQMIGRGLRPAPGKTDCILLDHAGGVHRHGRPDDDIAWTLATDQKAENKTQAARVAKAGVDPFVECEGCGHIRMKGMACDACGYEPPKYGRDVETTDGELVELGKLHKGPSIDEQMIFYAELRGFQRTARTRAGLPYAKGWAAAQYKSKFHGWPPYAWNNHPIAEPSAVTLRWIKSKQIAFWRAKERERAG